MRKGGVVGSLALLRALLSDVLAADSAVPRGVGPDFAKFYSSTQSFTCISNPTFTLSASQVNDDYCDCPDGSDEPGTSACGYISSLSPHSPPHPNTSLPDSSPGLALALPGFYCINRGHNPAYVPFTYINDGICDYEVCCDGSDEWAHVGGKQCPDKCKEIGKEWRKQDNVRRTSLNAATRKRRELVAAAAVKKKEVEIAIKDLADVIKTSEVKVKELEKEMAETEKKEANKVVKSGGAGKLGILVGLTKGRLAELRASLGKLRKQRDAYVARVGELEEILSTFKTEYNPNFNDEGVKRAVRSWDDYAAKEKDLLYEQHTPEEVDLDSMLDRGEESDSIDWADFENGEEQPVDDVAALYDLTSYIPPTLRAWLTSQLSSLRDMLITNGILAPRPTPDGVSESTAVREARERLTSAQNLLSTQNSNKRNHEDDLVKDYGADDVFRTLKGQCINLDSGEYNYELCWMEKVQQKSKKGSGNQNMGVFSGFATEMVDEEQKHDGKGLGSGERVVMNYENGSHCWNGPERSTKVVLGCSEKEEVWRVSEEEKCVYRMEVGTPAVCVDAAAVGGMGNQKEKKVGERDEL